MILLGPHYTCDEWLTNEIIRFNTHHKLQLRHTCCKFESLWIDGPPPDKEYINEFTDPDTYPERLFRFTKPEPDEVHELRNEDSEGIELLEDLMIEFQEKRGDQDCMAFLEGYWTTRMAEVRRARGKVDIEKTREMGVVWDKFECSSATSVEKDDQIEDSNEGGLGNGEEQRIEELDETQEWGF